MKTCLICHTIVVAAATTCPACGEGSFSTAALRAANPVASDAKAAEEAALMAQLEAEEAAAKAEADSGSTEESAAPASIRKSRR